MNTYTITPDNAPKIREWLQSRGGVAVWRNCNMSSQSLGTEAFTPATHADGKPATPPGWQYGNTPEAIVMDAAAFAVQLWRETERVKVMPSKYGPPCDPISRGRKRLDAALAAAGPGATWRWDQEYYQWGSAWRQVIVEALDKSVPLPDWQG